MKIAIVVSRFNQKITKPLLQGCLERLSESNITLPEQAITWVPGAVELPLIAQQYAKAGQYDAVICLGAVIRGETSHYDYVCEQASQGCQQVMLQYQLPVIFGVLTTENTAQAIDRLGGAHGHKGRDAAEAALEMIVVMQGFSRETVDKIV